MVDYEVELWLTPAEIERIEYSDYWNDEEKEKSKHWYILDGDFEKMERHLKKTKLLPQLDYCISYLRHALNRPLHGVGADLAAGNLWAVPRLLSAGQIDRVYCVEYSNHRLLKLGTKVLEYYEIPAEKVVLCLGSFYELKLPSHSLDFILLAQAFHHADSPHRLLAEIGRVLKPQGVVFVIGEHYAPAFAFGASAARLLSFLLSNFVPKSVQKAVFSRTFEKKTILRRQKVSPPDPVLGDHYYSDGEYGAMFSRHGFKYHEVQPPKGFILINTN